MPVRLVAVLAMALGACAPMHRPDGDGARAVAARAVRTLRQPAPSQARLIERLVADAEIATANELAAPWWQRETGRGQAAWLRVVLAARQAMASHRAVVASQEDAFARLRDNIQSELLRARAEIRETGMGRREAAAMERAEVAFDTALRLAAGGQHERALDKLRRAREDTAVVHAGWLALHARFSDARLRRDWRAIAEAAITESRISGGHAIVVDKLKRQLTLYYRGLRMATFDAELGANGLRRKAHAGDRATPEGLYRVTQLKQGRQTKYYKALLIDYPNAEDRARYSEARRRGAIPGRAGIGSLIEIHGNGGDGTDWTDGCVALTNQDMDVVFARARIGTVVAIVGTYGS